MLAEQENEYTEELDGFEMDYGIYINFDLERKEYKIFIADGELNEETK